MGDSALFGWRAAVVLQGLLAASTFLVVAFAPPEVGRTLLIPLNGNPINQTMLERAMLTRLYQGPLPGSLIVEGRGRALAPRLFDQGIIMLAAPAALCSGASAQGVRRDG